MVSLLCGLSRICVSRLTKGLVTHVTFVWFFSCVDYHVSVCPAETNLPDLSDLQAAVSDFQLYLPPAPPSDSDLLLPAQQWQLSAYQSAIVDESDRTEDNRLTLQHTCAQSQKWIMGVCFVNDTVFLVRSDSSTIWVIPWRGFYWQSHCAIEDWLAFGHSCISSSQLSVCRSQPVHTTALCWFGICHPHGVVYAKMAGGDCDW